MEKKTICVDFDGVIAQYDGFKGNDIFGDPIDGVQSAMEVLKRKDSQSSFSQHAPPVPN
ncbi:hypothetical protein NXW30_14985 [Phocaeicola vulgatus]|nr:hypothetical protein [Phocaeicola vulgatus]